MKATITRKETVEVKSVRIVIPVQYVGDSNNDDIPQDFPLLNGNVWTATIDIDTGKIENWQQGRSERLFVNVCDEGTYTLLDENQNVVSEISKDYVPNKIIPGKLGDYVNLKINADGVIENWPKSPDLSNFPNFEDDDE